MLSEDSLPSPTEFPPLDSSESESGSDSDSDSDSLSTALDSKTASFIGWESATGTTAESSSALSSIAASLSIANSGSFNSSTDCPASLPDASSGIVSIAPAAVESGAFDCSLVVDLPLNLMSPPKKRVDPLFFFLPDPLALSMGVGGVLIKLPINSDR